MKKKAVIGHCPVYHKIQGSMNGCRLYLIFDSTDFITLIDRIFLQFPSFHFIFDFDKYLNVKYVQIKNIYNHFRNLA